MIIAAVHIYLLQGAHALCVCGDHMPTLTFGDHGYYTLTSLRGEGRITDHLYQLP